MTEAQPGFDGLFYGEVGVYEIGFIELLNENAVPVYNDGRRTVKHFRGFLVHDRDEIICAIAGSGISEITANDEVSGER